MRTLLLILVCSISFGQSRPANTSSTTTTQKVDEIIFSARFITSQYKYTEPTVMNIKGTLFGLGLEGEMSASSGLTLKGELDLLAGNPQYDGALMSGAPKSHPSKDYSYEIRGLIGKEIPQNSSIDFVWMAGLGHRYFNDKGQDESAYEREQTYNYIPLIGILNIEASNTVIVKPYVEIDVFLNGKNTSHLNDVDPSYPKLKFRQDSGFGSRMGVVVSKKFVTFLGFTKLDYTNWSIDASEVNSGFAEPKNKTEMTSLSLGAIF